LFLCILSCSEKQKNDIGHKNNLYIDSLRFRHYKKIEKPYLVSSVTYAYSDSMSQLLDGLDLGLLKAMNSTDLSYGEPLSYERHLDTIVVDLTYSRGNSMFVFGEIKTLEDSIFISFSGDVYLEIPKISRRFNVPHRFYRSEFKILVDTTKEYLIFYRHFDSVNTRQR
jgi:hypothetical protein